ncbi:unnamed protein product [Rhizoctonia solani]|uniref:Transmembrane protein n=1 Tax=Rhizoctonia solani TaxID=456999 RepID=A0A8H3B7P9_9AGAM|nr:unnamed protein product [Rhizoctonia solani]
MVGIQVRDDASVQMPQSAPAPTQSIPLWVPIVICAVLVVVPVSIYLTYLVYARRPRRVEDKEATYAPSSPDIKWTDPFDTRRPSTNKWTLSIPKWTTPGGGIRRGSDGGFPPGTRHIALPDPTLSPSVESLDSKVPPSPGPRNPVHIRYPTPPPAAHVAMQSSERSYARAF